MGKNVAFDIGNVIVIDKADADYDFFAEVLRCVEGKAKSLRPAFKLLVYNRLGACLSINRLGEFTPKELFLRFGADEPISNRTLNRTLERLGSKAALIMANYQRLIKRFELVSKLQHTDFSSSFFVGDECKMAKLGYSRDHRPGNPQITFGICVGENKIPTALTIQNGNVVDKKHMEFMLKMCSRVLAPSSILIFDCGGNTKKNKQKIRDLGFEYLTLKPKKKKPYKAFIQQYLRQKKEKTLVKVNIGEQVYYCAKIQTDGEFQYIFFSEKTKKEQLKIKRAKLERKIEKNDELLKKVVKGKDFKPQICSKGYIVMRGSLQKCLDKIPNPLVTGLEGYFVLESSQDMEPQRALEVYKDRDKAEKMIRDMKEGAEIRPIRHWSNNAVKGYLLVIFLTNALINLTLLKAKNHGVSNLKLLKKYLCNLTLTVVYPKNAFRFEVLSNISAEMRALFGDFLQKYGDHSLELRW